MIDIRTTLSLLLISPMLITLVGCSPQSDVTVDVQNVLEQPKQYVGSDVCKTCHLEHYDAWKKTLHSRMLQSVEQNQDAIIVDLDEKRIRQDLSERGDKLKVASDEIFIPDPKTIKYTIGSQWKQRYLFDKDGELYISCLLYTSDAADDDTIVYIWGVGV